MKSTHETLLSPGDGKSYWVFGDLYTFKVTGKETNGAFTLMDQIVQVGGGPPPHIHRREDEAFYVLEGKFSFLCGGEERVFEPGGFVYIPKGILHTFKNIGHTPGRLLVTITPAGLEDFFYEMGIPAQPGSAPPSFDPSIIDKLPGVARRFDMEIKLT